MNKLVCGIILSIQKWMVDTLCLSNHWRPVLHHFLEAIRAKKILETLTNGNHDKNTTCKQRSTTIKGITIR
jgi:hypothetical protein